MRRRPALKLSHVFLAKAGEMLVSEAVRPSGYLFFSLFVFEHVYGVVPGISMFLFVFWLVQCILLLYPSGGVQLHGFKVRYLRVKQGSD